MPSEIHHFEAERDYLKKLGPFQLTVKPKGKT